MKYKNLDLVADKLAHDFLITICNEAVKVDQPEMPYRVQYVLEEVIKKLQEKV
jgi:hypothetical protein